MKEVNIVPNFKTELKGMYNAIVSIENKFLQGLIDVKGLIIHERDYFILFCYESLVMLKVRENCIYIECIATPYDLRRNGSATKAMNALCYVADKTNTILKLQTANVGYNTFQIPPLPIAIGAVKKNKIPVSKLVSFYLKFGFKQKMFVKKNQWVMIYEPKQPEETTTTKS